MWCKKPREARGRAALPGEGSRERGQRQSPTGHWRFRGTQPQSQPQPQPQSQSQTQAQAQGQVQVQAQTQGQVQTRGRKASPRRLRSQGTPDPSERRQTRGSRPGFVLRRTLKGRALGQERGERKEGWEGEGEWEWEWEWECGEGGGRAVL